MIVFRDVSTRHRHTVCQPEAHSSSVAWQVWVMLKRNLIRVRRRPEMLIQLLLQPIAFMLFFTHLLLDDRSAKTRHRTTVNTCCRASRRRR